MGSWLHGYDVQKATSLDEILATAQLDYDVETTPIQTADGIEIPGRVAIRRVGTRQVFGVVTDSYEPVNPRGSFAIVDDLLQTGRASAINAGPLRDGKEAFVQLKLDRTVKLTDDDTIDNFLFLHTGFDGHHALSGVLGPVRLQCTNMLQMAFAQAQSSIRYSHTQSIHDRLADVETTLNLVDKYVDTFETTATKLVGEKFSTNQMRSLLQRLIPLPKDANPDKDRAAKNKVEARNAIMAIFANGENLANVRETKWAAYNAVAEYFDHQVTQRVRTGGLEGAAAEAKLAETRFMRVLEDTKLKDKAFALLNA
jgi:phage/plasmid-like protein (TIGR03299 family)